MVLVASARRAVQDAVQRVAVSPIRRFAGAPSVVIGPLEVVASSPCSPPTTVLAAGVEPVSDGWKNDLPRAALRGALVTLTLGLALVASRGVVAASVASAVLVGACTLALTLVEGRLAARVDAERLGPGSAYLILWAVAATFALALEVQSVWTTELLATGYEAALAAVLSFLGLARGLVLAAVLGSLVALASFAQLERGRADRLVYSLMLLAFIACFPGVILLGALTLFRLADALADRLRRGPAVEGPEVPELRRRMLAGEVPHGRVWLLAYLGDAVARQALDARPDAFAPEEDLGAWLERLERAGRWAGVRAALAVARLVLPGLRAARPDDLRADAVVVAVATWLDAPGDGTLRDVREALGLLDAPGPAADVVRAAALACEGNDRLASRMAALQAAAAGRAAVEVGLDPEEVRATVTEALRSWAAPARPDAGPPGGDPRDRPAVDYRPERA